MASVGPQNFTTFSDFAGVATPTTLPWDVPSKAAANDDDPATAAASLLGYVGQINLVTSGAVNEEASYGSINPTADYAYYTAGSVDGYATFGGAWPMPLLGSDVKAAGFGIAVLFFDSDFGGDATDYLVCTGADFSAIPDAANIIGLVAEVRTRTVSGDVQVDHVRLTLYYTPPPTVDSVTPAYGPAAGGTAVTVAGRDFLDSPNPIGVTFDGVPATGIVLVSPTKITCTVPAHADGLVDVVVTNGDGQTGTKVGGYVYGTFGAPQQSGPHASLGVSL